MMKNLNGRNNSILFEKDGVLFIKKQIIGDAEDVQRRYTNLLYWDNILRSNREIHSPLIEYKDDNSHTIIYKWLEGAENLQDKITNSSCEDMAFYIYKAAELMKKISKLSIEKARLEEKKHSNLISPIIALSEEKYVNSTGGELELFAILQHDNQLKERIINNKDSIISEGAKHGDLRLDQFVVTPDNKVWIIDFEEFGYGNQLIDIAGILGSILFDSLYRTFSSIDGDNISETEINKHFMNNGEKNLRSIQPIMRKVYHIYKNNDDFLEAREISKLIGSFLIERVMSRAQFTFRLSDIDKAIVGVGRQAILYPDSVLELLL